MSGMPTEKEKQELFRKLSELKKEINDIIINPKSFINSFFKQGITSRLLADHLTQQVDNRKLLWTLFVLENWLKHNRFSRV